MRTAPTAGLVALMYGIVEAGERGWTDPVALLTAAGGGVLLMLFLRTVFML